MSDFWRGRIMWPHFGGPPEQGTGTASLTEAEKIVKTALPGKSRKALEFESF
ncbi:MAG: hypothetical protein IKG93_04040 [Clostridiales bacterium]|nr:hypothetical protein [Clostridiales bacterium]